MEPRRIMTLRAAGAAAPFLLAPLLLSVAGCDNSESELPDANQAAPVRVEGSKVGGNAAELPGTPMNERVAVIGLLNKRNGLTRDLKMKPGEALRVGDAIVRLQACETSAPWENMTETGAFVQLDVRSNADGKWRRNFSGWLFKERPERNVVQHPIYDVWVKSCTMEWPETGPDTITLGGKSDGKARRGASGDAASSAENATEAAAPAPVANIPRPAPSGTP
jgi:hypothetical protein